MQDKIVAFLLALKAEGRSPRTIETYRWRLCDLREFVGKPTLEMSPEDLDCYLANLRSHGLSPVTVYTRTLSIKTYFNWCVERGYLDRSPARHLKNSKPKQLCSGPMEEENLRRLLVSAKKWAEEKGKPRDLAIIRFIADTGCRPGELRALTVDNVNLEKREAFVDGKTGGRWVNFTELTAKAIQNWLEVRPNTDCPYLFLSYNTKGPLTSSGLYQIFRRYALRLGIAGRYNPHSIRHLMGQLWLDDGANLVIVQKKLGHTDIRTTAMFYSHQDERVKLATERFSLVKKLDE